MLHTLIVCPYLAVPAGNKGRHMVAGVRGEIYRTSDRGGVLGVQEGVG